MTRYAAIGDRSSMAFGGNLVNYGTATGLVVATGANTELGRIATLIEGATDLETPLTRAVGTIGKYIAVAIVVISAVILTIVVLRATGAGLPLNDALHPVIDKLPFTTNTYTILRSVLPAGT